jgi:hypothetical protein
LAIKHVYMRFLIRRKNLAFFRTPNFDIFASQKILSPALSNKYRHIYDPQSRFPHSFHTTTHLKTDLFFNSKMMRLEKVKTNKAMTDVLKIGVSSNEKATLLNMLFTLVRSTLSE